MDNLILLHELQVFMIRFDENVQEEPTGQMDIPQGKKSKMGISNYQNRWFGDLMNSVHLHVCFQY
jgi:hypothetical protein